MMPDDWHDLKGHGPESTSARRDAAARRDPLAHDTDSARNGRGAPRRSSAVGGAISGIALATGIGVVATVAAKTIGVDLLGYARSPISAIPLAVLLGLLVRDTVGVPEVCEPGLNLCVKRVLRIGVVLLGIRLSLADAGATGLVALPLVTACMVAAFLIVRFLARLLAIPDRLGTLIAVGTSICGVTAIVATAPAIGATDDEASYAVATIALFGTVALFAYPWLANLIFANPTHAGLFLGTAIHDTSQVAGAALTFDQQFGPSAALNVAVVTKLVRNSLMVAVIPVARALHARAGDGVTRVSWLSRVSDAVPLFIVGFLLMAAVRTVGDLGDRPFGILDPAMWDAAIAALQQVAELALLLAMAAVGLSTSMRRLRMLGIRPIAVGMAAALCVGGVSVALIHAFG